ncbi:MAG TPA: hypothetical protein VHX36_14930 [Candidatus Acidoferrales bacterium]|jgi:hypothetical protein|nr:hypothetical protein [Candidatus Acidoferrales bacterium]
MMSKRSEIYVLVALLVVLAGVLYYYLGPSDSSATPAVAATTTRFQPLDVQEPQLRVDLLARLQKLEYTGTHRNIFVAEPPPPPKQAQVEETAARFVGPRQPPPPPPVQVPGELFGYAAEPTSGHRVAFFTEGDDVLVVAEGATFLGRFRLVHVTDSSADVEEISTGRHAMVPMVQPPPGEQQ